MPITHREGQLFALSSGEYSDYRFNGLYRALSDVNLNELSVAYVEQVPVDECWTGVEPVEEWMKSKSDTGFGAYLIARGLAEEIDYDEIHVGNYGDFTVHRPLLDGGEPEG